MARRNDNGNAYRINTETGNYIVLLERLKNDACGNPRYKASIIILSIDGEEERTAHREPLYTPVFTFQGHYCGDVGECEYIVNLYETERK